MTTRNPLQVAAVDEYVNEVFTQVDGGASTTGAALVTALRAYDSLATGAVVKDRLRQVLETAIETRTFGGGEIISVAVAGGGTGYAIGELIPIGGGAGIGAVIEVTSVSGGVIDGVQLYNGSVGQGYDSGTVAADTTGVGGADATFTITVNEGSKIIADALVIIETA